MTPDDKYSLPNSENLPQPIQMQLSPKEKTFSDVFLHLSKLQQIFNMLKKEMTLIAYVFSKLGTAIDVVR